MLRGAYRSQIRQTAAKREPGSVLACAASMVLENLEGRRLLSAGELDPTFGTAGIAREHFGSSAIGTAVAIQHGATPTGDKILIVGSLNAQPALFRFNLNGSYDSTFGNDGVVSLPGEAVVDVEVVTYGTPSTADDKIVVTGQMTGLQQAYITRLDGIDGAKDLSFGGTGVVALNTAGTQIPTDAAVDGSGNVFVTGTDDTATVLNTFVTKLDNSGLPDPAFGAGTLSPFAGTSILSLDALQEQIGSIALQGNKIVVAGQLHTLAGVARFDATGSLDSSFDGEGISAGINTDYTVNRVVVSSSGEIYTLDAFVGVGSQNQDAGIALRHYASTDGAFDAGFGNGQNLIDRFADGVHMPGTGLAIAADGSFLASTHYFQDSGASNLAVAKFTTSGARDVSFGDGGLAVEPGSGFDVGLSIVIQGDDKAIVAGYDAVGNVVAARFLTNVAPSVAPANASVSAAEGSPVANTGTFLDTDFGENVSISASVGAVTHTGTNSGTWSWSLPTTDNTGPITVTITAQDQHGHVATTTFDYTVTNVAPTAHISAPASRVVNQPTSFTFSATDPSSADTAAGFTYHIDWGDSHSQDVVGPASGVNVQHIYRAENNFTISVVAEDKDHGMSVAATKQINVGHVMLESGELGVGGDGSIEIQSGSIIVVLNGVQIAHITDPVTSLVIYAGDGIDQISVAPGILVATTLLGGDGNDVLHVGGGTTTLDGGGGSNTLYGGSGAATIVNANAGSNTLIAGSGSFSVSGGGSITTLSASGGASANEGASYTLSLSHSDSGHTLQNWIINWGDTHTDTLASGASSVSHAYADNGSNTIVISAVYNDATYDLPNKSVSVQNVAPTASITGAPSIKVTPGTLISLGSLVHDDGSNDTTFTYAWTVKKNGVSFASGTSPSINFTPDAAATYAVSLVVTDKDGAPSTTATASIQAIASSVSGIVFADGNNNGQVDFGEMGIQGVSVHLSGTDDLGAVSKTVFTDVDGAYLFLNLRPGTYSLSFSQPAGYTVGIKSVGTASGNVNGSGFGGIVVGENQDGFNYNVAELTPTITPVEPGQAAQVGFWQNKNGQNLIKSLNGGATATVLGNWLASNFPHMFGSLAGANNLTGKTNTQVGSFYQQQFKLKGMKIDANVLATALSVYVTNSNLAGNVAASYGFLVTSTGLGAASYNVGTNGAAFGVTNETTMRIIDLLNATDAAAVNGVLYGGNSQLRQLANNVYAGVNSDGSND